MRHFTTYAVAALLTLTGCSSGGGGSSAAGSTGPKGTGYLKIALPELPQAGVASVGIGSLAQVITSASYAEAPDVLANALVDLNTAEACIGGTGNIPFVICIIESLGINAPGTYEGKTPKGDAARVVVSDITGDPDGYTLQAVVTLTGNSEEVFMYKADADGKSGIVEMKPDSIFASSAPGTSGLRMTWDASVNAAQAVEYTHHYSGTSSSIVSEQVGYILAVVNGLTGVADIASRNYMYVDNMSGFVEANSRFAQSRVGFDRAIVLHTSCTNGSSPVEGNQCFAPSAATLDVLESGKPLSCGTVSTTGAIELSLKEALPLSNSTMGSWAYGPGFTVDATCETLRTTVGAADAFIIRLDKNDAPAATIRGIHHIMRAKSYSDLKLLSNVGFL